MQKMRNIINTALRCETGQSLVELALTVPLLFLLLVGGAELARMAYYGIAVENAAHSAALYAAQDTATASDITNITAVADSAAANIGGSNTLQITSVTNSCTCFDPVAGTNSAMASCSAACPAPDTIIQYVQVNTKATANPLFKYPGLEGNTFSVYGSSTMAVGQ